MATPGNPLQTFGPQQTPAPAQDFNFSNYLKQRFDAGDDDESVFSALSADAEKDPNIVKFIKSRGWDDDAVMREIQAGRQVHDLRKSQEDVSWAQFNRDMQKYLRSGTRAGINALGQGVAGGIVGGPPGAITGALTGAGTQLGLDWFPGISNFTTSVDQPLGGTGDASMGSNALLEILKQGITAKLPGGALARNPGKTIAGQGALSWLAGEGTRRAEEGTPTEIGSSTIELGLESALPGLIGGFAGRGNRAFDRSKVKRIIDTTNKYDSAVQPIDVDRAALTSGAEDIRSVNLAEDIEKDWLGQFQKKAEGAAPYRKKQQTSNMASQELNWIEQREKDIRARGGRNELGRFASKKPNYSYKDQLRRTLEENEGVSSAGIRALEDFDIATRQYRIAASKLADIRNKTGFDIRKMSPDEKMAFEAISKSKGGSDALLKHADSVIDNALGTSQKASKQSDAYIQLTGLTSLLKDKPELLKAVQSRAAGTIMRGFGNVNTEQGQQLMKRISALGPEASEKLFGNKEAYKDLIYLGEAFKEVSNFEKQKVYAGLSSTLRPFFSHLIPVDPEDILNRHLSGAFDPEGKFDPQGFAKRVHNFIKSPAVKQMTPAMAGERLANIFKMYGVSTPEQNEAGQ